MKALIDDEIGRTTQADPPNQADQRVSNQQVEKEPAVRRSKASIGRFSIQMTAIAGLIFFISWVVLPRFSAVGSPGTERSSLDDQKAVAPSENAARPKAENDDIARTEDLTLVSDGSGNNASSDEHRQRLENKVNLLKLGRAFMKSVSGYTTHLSKQEVVRGELLDEQSLLMKCRHKPFSVYLRWTAGDVGREVIYIEGANQGKMIAHDGGWKARIPAFYLSPDCMLAMRDARRPVTDAGILFLTETMLGVHEHDLSVSNLDSCIVDHEEFDGRRCLKFTTKYQSSALSPVYRKSITLIDSEWNIPLQSQHFEWATRKTYPTEKELDAATLIEKYSFHDLVLHQEFSEKAFDRSNEEYKFR